MKKKRKKWVLALAGCGLAGAAAVVALNDRLTVRTYALKTERVSVPIRLALLSDLHSCSYGQGQEELLAAVEAQAPDLVLLGGDILDDDPALPEGNAWTAVAALAEAYPVYYVTGNHELWSGRAAEIKERMSGLGATVLAGTCHTALVRGQRLNLCGIDDPSVGAETWSAQLQGAFQEADGACFTLLLTHRPERIETYLAYGPDLVLAGHAHGGQWRLPGLMNGLLAPNQGLFPAYAGGAYRLGGTTLVVSRGLARETTRVPRIFNPPELVVVDLLPE